MLEFFSLHEGARMKMWRPVGDVCARHGENVERVCSHGGCGACVLDTVDEDVERVCSHGG